MNKIKRVLSASLATIFLSFVPVQSYAAENNPKLAYVYTEINGTAFVSIDNDFYLINDLWISQYVGKYIGVSISGVLDGIGDKLMYPNYNMTAVSHESSVFQVKKVFNNNSYNGYQNNHGQTSDSSEQPSKEDKQKPCKPYTLEDAYEDLGYHNLSIGNGHYTDSSGRKMVMLLPQRQRVAAQAEQLVKERNGCK